MNHKLRAMSYDTSYKQRVTSYDLLHTSNKLRANLWHEKSCLRQLLMVRYGTWTVVWVYGAKSYRILIEFSCLAWPVPAYDCMVQVLYHKIISRQKLDFQDHCTEPVICRILWTHPASSIQLLLRRWNRFCAPLMMVFLKNSKSKLGDNIVHQYRLFESDSDPLLNLNGQYL